MEPGVTLTHTTDTFASIHNPLVAAGFRVDQVLEPQLPEELELRYPHKQDWLAQYTGIIILRARPASTERPVRRTPSYWLSATNQLLMIDARRDDIPVLVHAALVHAQFETIHPFPDGNGRTGRALIHAILRHRGLTRNVTVPVSAGLLTDTNGYFDALTAYRSGEPEAIVTLMAEATFTAITNGRLLVGDLNGARERWSEKIEARRDAVIWRIMDLLLRQPVVDAALVERELNVTPANASRALLQLASAGVTKEFSDKKRNRLWQAPEVLSALDEFAARAGRRG